MLRNKFYDSLKRILFAFVAMMFVAPAFSATLPAGYTELEYIKSDGSGYIDTDIVPAGKRIGMQAGFKYENLQPATATIIGSGVTDGTDNCRLWGTYNGKWRIKLANQGMSYGTPDTNYHDVRVNMSDGGAYLDGTKVWDVAQITVPSTNTKVLRLFSDNSGGGTSSSSRIYYVRLYQDNDTLIAEYIPARDSSNNIGFYDTKNNRFLTAPSTFTAGPEFDPCRNLLNTNDPNRISGYLGDNNTIYDYQTFAVSDYISIPNGTTVLTYSTDRETNGLGRSAYATFYTSDKNYISSVNQGLDNVKTMSVPNNAAYIRVSFNTSEGNWQLESGSAATTYTAYNAACHNPCPNGGTLITYESATGTVSQSGTPSPTNPIEPVFYTQGNMVLRRVGDYADSYDATTGKITRRVGVKVLDGTENWFYDTNGGRLDSMYNLVINDMFAEASSVTSNRQSPYSTHFARSTNWISNSAETRLNKIQAYTPSGGTPILGLGYQDVSSAKIPTFKAWLAEQYAAGTPVIVYYPLKTAVVEDWAAEQCESGNLIKIATTKYNEDAFANLVTTLNSAITKVTNIVDTTVAQASSIGTLATTKQDRPADGDCPAGRKCLLVTGTDGKPHWYLIQE